MEKQTEKPYITRSDNSHIRDYTDIIDCKLQDTRFTSHEINYLIVLLNYCFSKRNNFFVANYNRNQIHLVKDFYDKLKTNILTESIDDVMLDVEENDFGPVKFILSNILNNVFDSHEYRESKLRIICPKPELAKLISKM